MDKIVIEIIKILVSNQEKAKLGSDGDYETIYCIYADDFEDVAKEIAILFQAVMDPENQPNQFGI